jgi:hypothetical protein
MDRYVYFTVSDILVGFVFKKRGNLRMLNLSFITLCWCLLLLHKSLSGTVIMHKDTTYKFGTIILQFTPENDINNKILNSCSNTDNNFFHDVVLCNS